MEQGGPNEDKQTKKQRSKEAVPTREQSSRYDILDVFIFTVTDPFPFIVSKTPTIRTNTSPSAAVRLFN
jgi:hypothetical protein